MAYEGQTKSSSQTRIKSERFKLQRKNHTLPGIRTGTSGFAVGSHNHCTIWVGIEMKIVNLNVGCKYIQEGLAI
jgi:hypothetical protein